MWLLCLFVMLRCRTKSDDEIGWFVGIYRSLETSPRAIHPSSVWMANGSPALPRRIASGARRSDWSIPNSRSMGPAGVSRSRSARCGYRLWRAFQSTGFTASQSFGSVHTVMVWRLLVLVKISSSCCPDSYCRSSAAPWILKVLFLHENPSLLMNATDASEVSLPSSTKTLAITICPRLSFTRTGIVPSATREFLRSAVWTLAAPVDSRSSA